jgi:polar amino acid transport system substrate-binding protein
VDNRLFYTLVIIFILFCSNANATSNHSNRHNQEQTLHVGVLLEMPFAQEINGRYSGIAVDIWEKIANQNHWKFSYIPISENVNGELNRLSKHGDLDVIIGPISITSQRLKKADFSSSFYLNTIGIITHKSQWGIYDIAKTLVSKNLLILILILLGTFIIYLSLLSQIEGGQRYRNTHYSNYLSITQRIWLHFFQKKVDYMPTTTAGRIIGIIWVIIAAAIFTAINANITSSMTIARYDPENITATIEGLQRAKIIGVSGQHDIEVAEKHGIYVKKIQHLSEGVNMLVENKVDGVVCDTPKGTEYIKRHDLKDLAMSQLVLENDGVSFAVRQNSRLLRAINLGITNFQDNNTVIDICKKYINDTAKCYI